MDDALGKLFNQYQQSTCKHTYQHGNGIFIVYIAPTILEREYHLLSWRNRMSLFAGSPLLMRNHHEIYEIVIIVIIKRLIATWPQTQIIPTLLVYSHILAKRSSTIWFYLAYYPFRFCLPFFPLFLMLRKSKWN